jgi:hypothetical protein
VAVAYALSQRFRIEKAASRQDQGEFSLGYLTHGIVAAQYPRETLNDQAHHFFVSSVFGRRLPAYPIRKSNVNQRQRHPEALRAVGLAKKRRHKIVSAQKHWLAPIPNGSAEISESLE